MSQETGQPPYGYGPPGAHGAGGYGPPGGGYPGGPPTAGSPVGGWSPSEAIGFGWKAVTSDYAAIGLPLALVALATTVASGAVGGAFGAVRGVVVGVLGHEGALDPMIVALITAGTSIVQNVVSLLIQAFFIGGAVDFSLQAARGKKPPLATVFGGGRFYVPMLIGQILMALACGVGMLLCIVPGIILGLGLMFWSFIVVDRGAAPMDALKESWELTKGHKGSLFVFALLAFLVMLAGVLACCFGVLFLSGPVLSLAAAYVYLRLRGESPTLPAG